MTKIPHHKEAIPTQELIPDPDIDIQLEMAFALPLAITLKNNPRVSPEDIAHRGQYFSRMASVPDGLKIRSFESPTHDYEVTTYDPEQYPLLLAQSMRKLEIVKGLADPIVIVTEQLERVVKHETTHGQMASAFGLGSRYGVRVLYDPDEDAWALSPFHAIIGDDAGIIMLTRLEEAAIAMAPEDASPGDLHTAFSLGYSSREEVLDQLYTVYPDLQPLT